MVLHETLFALGPCIQYASATCSPQTRLHTLGLWNIFLATGLLGAIQSNLGASAVIAVGLEERIAREPAMTVGDLVDNIWSTNS